MKSLLAVVILMIFSVAQTGHCQTVIQSEDGAPLYLGELSKAQYESFRNPKGNFPDMDTFRRFLKTSPEAGDLQEGIRKMREKTVVMGGGDSGGGSGVIESGGRLRLHDLAQCSAARKIPAFDFAVNYYSPSLSEISRDSLRDILEQNIHLEDKVFEKLLITSAVQTAWYVVYARVQWDRVNKGMNPNTIAVFKRPLGVVLSAEKLSQLSGTDLLGLFVHEGLRMMTIGFGAQLSDSEIEEITCRIVSGQNVAMSMYPDLATLRKEKFENLSDDRVIHWMENVIYYYNRGPGFYNRRGLFEYQSELSKFEAFASPNLSPSDYDNAFFGWAGSDGPSHCSSIKSCNYSETWPTSHWRDGEGSIRPAKWSKWSLHLFNEEAIGWTEKRSGADFILSRKAVSENDAAAFCQRMSDVKREPYVIDLDDSSITPGHAGDSQFKIINRDTPANMGFSSVIPTGRIAGDFKIRLNGQFVDGHSYFRPSSGEPMRVLCIRRSY